MKNYKVYHLIKGENNKLVGVHLTGIAAIFLVSFVLGTSKNSYFDLFIKLREKLQHLRR